MKTDKEQSFSLTRLSLGSQDVSQVRAAPGEEEVESSVRKTENKVVQDPRLSVEDRPVKDTGDLAGESRASVDTDR